MASDPRFDIELLAGRFAVARLAPGAPLPGWATGDGLTSVTRTAAELSIVCPSAQVPSDVPHEHGFCAMFIRGPLDFGAVGVLSALSGAIAQAQVPILAISTFETDWVLVREADLPAAAQALRDAGHRLYETGTPPM